MSLNKFENVGDSQCLLVSNHGCSSSLPLNLLEMNINNPFAQGGWSNTNSSSQYPNLEPSVYGALPYSSGSSNTTPNSVLTFQFTAFNPTILNCTVLGPGSTPYFRVVDNNPFTVFQNKDGRSIAVIEWRQSPGTVVEVRDIIQKQLVSTWLALSPDRTYRTMIARNMSLVWLPRDDYVGLFTTGSSADLYAKIIRGNSSVTLQITSQAVQLGLLESCIVAVVLLQSGRRID
ncbi:hypothetical protein Moror_5353 [Moniliophthora roreri MCA 2997]|uniref:Uncharacterized protein n=1 Tax=Moniliophthora roreri (strain MCA 2997) TaxID=1381753 RepID=V2WQF0_MONRO|nr:hypothetical protein Moror_5353 [Moniliophthora roreri MCA 2997]